MGNQNRLLEALNDYDNDSGINRRDLKEALAELSTSRKRKIQKNLDATICSQIFKFFIGLIILFALLTFMFIFGSRYLFEEKPNDQWNHLLQGKYVHEAFMGVSNFFSKPSPKALTTKQPTTNFSIPSISQGQNYYIQVAICRLEKCNNIYTKRASYLGFPYDVITLKAGKTTAFKEIISVQKMDLQKAQNLAEFINTVNDRSGYANIVGTEDGMFRVSLGSFPNPDIAEDLRRYYESLAVTESVQFTYKASFVASGSGLSKILIGPFSTRKEVSKALQQVRQDKILVGSFVISK